MGVILIAFERESEQSALEKLLSGRGHRVVRAANGLSALDNARREPPHAVVSDIVLPRMDGFALCRKWKQDERLQAIPFLFYTRRHDDPKYERFALELGAERFLARSMSPDALLTALDELLAETPSKSSSTTPLPALNEAAIQRVAALEEARQAELEQARQVQTQLRGQISELEMTNQRLAAGEARFRRLFEGNPLPMWIVDRASGGIIAVNDAALVLYGYGRAEFLALNAAALEIPGADAAATMRTQRHKDGSEIAVSATSQQIEFDGRSAELSCACDVRSRAAAEHGLRQRMADSDRQLEFFVELFRQSERLDEAAIVSRALQHAAADDATVALLDVANRDAAHREPDQEKLSTFADGVWRVIQARRAHAQMLRSVQRTDVALQGMIDSFVRVSEWHDPYTAGSARRLAALAVALGREAGLDGERQHALRIAALLHDIGNIAVPASILAKPAPLSETEQALMRTHVEAGCQLLADIDFGAPIADIIYQSHERCDGSGYPRGLRGEEILLEARILAIADTVEAMCSPRAYRPAATMQAALDEINRGAGGLYDPHLIAACTRLIRDHGFVLPE